MILLNSMLGRLPTDLGSHQTETRNDNFQTNPLVSQKVIKWSKEGVILIILKLGHFFVLYVFWYKLYCFEDSVVVSSSLETSSYWSFRLLTGYFHVKSDSCIARCSCITYGKVLRLLLCFGPSPIASFFS